MSSNFHSTANTIRTRFISEWTAARPSIPIHHQNGPVFEPASNQWFTRLSVIPGGNRLALHGGANTYRPTGVVDQQVFAPRGIGDGELREVIDDARAIFLAMTVSGVVFFVPQPQAIGPSGAHYQWNVMTPYQADYLGS